MEGEGRKPDFGELPPIPGIDFTLKQPIGGGLSTGSRYEPEYLDYTIKSRGPLENVFSYCGTAYLAGVIGGGGVGLMEGVRSSPSSRFRILFNSIMNNAGKRGSRAGNAFGCVALFYSGFLALYDGYNVDMQLGVGDWVNPVLSGASTGLLYKSTAGPRAAILAAVLGGGVIGASFGVEEVVSNMLGYRVGRLFG
uniref:Mitochondrial import inner membrane translocase subunit TIM23 n=1 Tax=Phaeomonas parva TaxID=124430 RepID=A0A7S1XNQ0_9STRA|eukprot:CAMPEP_0118863294 /NCGR_PEP_ID=MMETSP1163-20130328/8223_1 /TAXON_ID=124430 /ORGANISM="Phaeomonas parva, Strain CCMP2877" /LENGTH=194 /DNA_ID=CAMNT_0006797285 /DNA_START=19 /DNA_END=603 /DNA_ORIENTATION=+